RRLDQADHARHESFESCVATDELCVREPTLEVAKERLKVVAEEDRANAHVARGDQDGAEGALADGEANHGTAPAFAVAARRHPESTTRLRVEAAARREPRPVDRLRDGTRAPQRTLRAFRTHRVRVGLWRDPGDLLERPFQVMRAPSDASCQFLETRRRLGLLEEPAER